MHRDGGGLTVRFWGTRGSLPSPGAQSVRYGGNTSCVEVRAGEHLLIFDAGSGLRELGNHLLPSMPVTAHVFFTHYHWDHIMGLPFFGPLFVPGNDLHFYGESKADLHVGRVLSGQMQSPYFPVTMEVEARANLHMHDFAVDEVLTLGPGVKVSACRLNHPDEALGFRVDCGGRAVVYATDSEHHPEKDRTLIEFARGADVLIYDSTYTDAEYASHLGWGHSTWHAGVDIAAAAGVPHFVIFHHLPERTDGEVAAIERIAKRAFPGAMAAREGMELRFPPVVKAETGDRPNGAAKKRAARPASGERRTPRAEAGRRLKKPAKQRE